MTGLYFTLHLISLTVSPYLSSFGGDEHISFYGSARNFNKFGFWASTFLQDLSTSSSPDEHPFVYDHMGAGPEIVTALITRVVGERYRLVRLCFALMFVTGLYCYYRFASIVLGTLGMVGAGYTFLLFDPMAIMGIIDHPGQAMFPMFAFLPLLLIYHGQRTNKQSLFWAAQVLIVVSTFCVTYQLVVLNMVSSLFLWKLGLFPLKRRDVIGIVASSVLGVLLHIVQNVCHLGVGLAIHELLLTISNRATGYPTGQELVLFYQSINVVHNGGHSFRPNALFSAYLDCISKRVLKEMALLSAVVILCKTVGYVVSKPGSAGLTPALAYRDLLNSLSGFFKLAVWVCLSILVAVLIFPAYSADYNLQGNGHFLGAILGVGFFMTVCRTLVLIPSTARSASESPSFFKPVLPTIAAGLIGLAVLPFVLRQYGSVRAAYREARTDKYQFLHQIEAYARNEVTMSNMYPPTVGFFTREKVFGVAEMESFPEGRPPDPFAAYCKMIAGLPMTGECRPKYYIHSRVLLPGFGKSLDPVYNEQLRLHIAKHHPIVYEDKLLTIFELIW